MKLTEKIVKKKDGYYVQSEDGKKNLGGPYNTEDEAKRRLQQVHYFKNNNKKKVNEDFYSEHSGDIKIIHISKVNKGDIVLVTNGMYDVCLGEFIRNKGLVTINAGSPVKNFEEYEYEVKVVVPLSEHLRPGNITNGFTSGSVLVYTGDLPEDKYYREFICLNSNNKPIKVFTDEQEASDFVLRDNSVINVCINTFDGDKLVNQDVFYRDYFKNKTKKNEDLTAGYEITRPAIYSKFKKHVDAEYKHAFEVGTDEAWERFYKEVNKMANFWNKKIAEHNRGKKEIDQWDLIDPKQFLQHYDINESFEDWKKHYNHEKLSDNLKDKIVVKEFNLHMTSPHEEDIPGAVLVIPNAYKTLDGYTFDAAVGPIDENGEGVGFSSVKEAQDWLDKHKEEAILTSDRDGLKLRLPEIDYLEDEKEEVVEDMDGDREELGINEGAEGKREPGFEYVIYDYTDEDDKHCPIVAKRSTKTEAEYIATKWMGNMYGEEGKKKYKDRLLTFERVPKGKFEVGDNFYGPFDSDYNLKEDWGNLTIEEASIEGGAKSVFDNLSFFKSELEKIGPEVEIDKRYHYGKYLCIFVGPFEEQDIDEAEEKVIALLENNGIDTKANDFSVYTYQQTWTPEKWCYVKILEKRKPKQNKSFGNLEDEVARFKERIKEFARDNDVQYWADWYPRGAFFGNMYGVESKIQPTIYQNKGSTMDSVKFQFNGPKGDWKGKLPALRDKIEKSLNSDFASLKDVASVREGNNFISVQIKKPENIKDESLNEAVETVKSNLFQPSVDPWERDTIDTSAWVKGTISKDGAEYQVSAKVFNEPSQYGINHGRISKLWVKEKGQPVAINYDRGWVDAPPYNEDLLNTVMKELEDYRDKHPISVEEIMNKSRKVTESKKLSESEENFKPMTLKEYGEKFLDGNIDIDVYDNEIDMGVAFVLDCNKAPKDYYEKFLSILANNVMVVDELNDEWNSLTCDFSGFYKPYNKQINAWYKKNGGHDEFEGDEGYYDLVLATEGLVSGYYSEEDYKELCDIFKGRRIKENLNKPVANEPYKTITEDYSYSDFEDYVRHYIGEDDLSLEEIWEEIYEREQDMDLANDVTAELEKSRNEFAHAREWEERYPYSGWFNSEDDYGVEEDSFSNESLTEDFGFGKQVKLYAAKVENIIDNIVPKNEAFRDEIIHDLCNATWTIYERTKNGYRIVCEDEDYVDDNYLGFEIEVPVDVIIVDESLTEETKEENNGYNYLKRDAEKYKQNPLVAYNWSEAYFREVMDYINEMKDKDESLTEAVDFNTIFNSSGFEQNVINKMSFLSNKIDGNVRRFIYEYIENKFDDLVFEIKDLETDGFSKKEIISVLADDIYEENPKFKYYANDLAEFIYRTVKYIVSNRNISSKQDESLNEEVNLQPGDVKWSWWLHRYLIYKGFDKFSNKYEFEDFGDDLFDLTAEEVSKLKDKYVSKNESLREAKNIPDFYTWAKSQGYDPEEYGDESDVEDYWRQQYDVQFNRNLKAKNYHIITKYTDGTIDNTDMGYFYEDAEDYVDELSKDPNVESIRLILNKTGKLENIYNHNTGWKKPLHSFILDDTNINESLNEDALDDQGVSWVGADVLADRVPSRVFIFDNHKIRGEDLPDYFGNDLLCLSGNRIVNRKQANESLNEAKFSVNNAGDEVKLVLDSYNHMINIGEIPSPDDILYDIIDNYDQDIFKDGGPFLEGKEIEAIKSILRSKGLEYKEDYYESLGLKEDFLEFDSEDEAFKKIQELDRHYSNVTFHREKDPNDKKKTKYIVKFNNGNKLEEDIIPTNPDEDPKAHTFEEVYEELKVETENFTVPEGFGTYLYDTERAYAKDILTRFYEDVKIEDTLIGETTVYIVTFNGRKVEEN